MISFFRKFWNRQFPPTIARVHQYEWDQARHARQLAPFVIDPISLATHGID